MVMVSIFQTNTNIIYNFELLLHPYLQNLPLQNLLPREPSPQPNQHLNPGLARGQSLTGEKMNEKNQISQRCASELPVSHQCTIEDNKVFQVCHSAGLEEKGQLFTH